MKEHYPYIPYNTSLKKYARSMRKHPTPAEKALYCIVKQRALSQYRFQRQKPLGNYIVDIYCSKLQLVIEADGYWHYDEEQYFHDEERTLFLQQYGLHVMRFVNDTILLSPEVVYEKIVGYIVDKVCNLQ
jgi:very-short-patch-repair endonuclease